MLLTELKAELNCHKRKLQLQWSSKVSKRYKRNLIVIDLNSAAGIAGVLTGRIPKIREKFLNANYLQKFIDSNINNLIGKKKRSHIHHVLFIKLYLLVETRTMVK